MMLDTAAAFNAVVRRYATDAEQADRIVANAFFRNMAGSLSGTQEYMAAETLHLLAGDERFDLVVVDTPPTRSALDFLAAPGVLARFLDHRLFKLLMLPARPGMRMFNVATQPVLRAIGKVVGTEVLADAVAFFQAFAGMEAGFRQRADDVIAPAARAVDDVPPRRRAAPRGGRRGGVVRRPARRPGHRPRRRRRQPGPPAVRRGQRGCRSRRPPRPSSAAGVQRALWHNLAELRAAARPSWRRSTSSSPCSTDARLCRGAAAGVRRPRPRGPRPHVGSHLFGVRSSDQPLAFAGSCVCCWRWTPTGSSTTSSPPSVTPTRRSPSAAKAAASAIRSPPSPSKAAPTTS